MKTYLIYGPNLIDFNLSNIKNNYDSSNHNLNIIESENIENFALLDIYKNSRVIIEAHGNAFFGNHYIALNSGEPIKTSDALVKIAANKPMNFELFSCFGSAVKSIFALPKFSSLITLAPNDKEVITSIDAEIIAQTYNFKHANNPFINYASYVFLYPDDSSFFLKVNTKDQQDGIKFQVLIDDKLLNQYKTLSLKNIHNWQVKVLTRDGGFLSFCKAMRDMNFVSELQHKQINKLEQLINNNEFDQFEVTDPKRFQELLFLKSVDYSKINTIKKLISGGVNIDTSLLTNETALHIVSNGGNNEVAKILLASGANVELQNQYGYTPLIAAAQYGHFKIVNELIINNALINSTSFLGLSALMLASQSGLGLQNVGKDYLQIVKKLLSGGADVNHVATKGETSLSASATAGNLEISKELIKAGAKVNIEKMVDGTNALDRACYGSNEEIIKLFFASGVNYHDENICSNMGAFKNFPALNAYAKNPVTYILNNNKVAILAVNALNNVKVFFNDKNIIENTMQCLSFYVKDCEKNLGIICEDKSSYQCLSAQAEKCGSLDLDSLCGENRSDHNYFSYYQKMVCDYTGLLCDQLNAEL